MIRTTNNEQISDIYRTQKEVVQQREVSTGEPRTKQCHACSEMRAAREKQEADDNDENGDLRRLPAVRPPNPPSGAHAQRANAQAEKVPMPQ